MIQRLERCVHVLGRMNTRCAPPALRRLDRWLLIHRPLVWRTGLHWIAWWSALASIVLIVLAASTQGSCASAWSCDSLVSGLTWVRGATLTAGICWAALQVRQPVGWLSGRRQAALALLNATAVALLAMPGFGFALAATHRIAHSIPNAEFEQEDAFHKGHLFWDCSPSLTQASVDADWPRLERSLERFGQLAVKPLAEASCAEGQHRIAFVDRDGPRLLKERLEAIHLSKELWQGRTGQLAEHLAAALFVTLILAVVTVTLIGVASQPRYVWRRLFFSGGLPALPSILRGRRFEPLARLDRWLLLRHPFFWATQAHRLFAITLVLLGIVVLVALPASGFRAQDVVSAVLASLRIIVALWPFAWLACRHNYRAEGFPVPSRRIVVSVLVAVLPIEVLGLVLAVFLDGRRGLLDGYFTVSTLGALCIAIVRTYRSRLGTFMIATKGLAANVMVVGISNVSVGWAAFLLLSFAALWCMARFQMGPAAGNRRLITSLIVVTPGMLLTCTSLLKGLVPKGFVPDEGLFSGALGSIGRPVYPLFGVAVGAFVIIAPLLTGFIKAELEPQRE